MGFFDVGLFWIYSSLWMATIVAIVVICYRVLHSLLGQDPVDWLISKIFPGWL